MREQVTHRGLLGGDWFLTRSPLSPVSPLDPGTPICPCQRAKHTAVGFWFGLTDLQQRRPGSEMWERSLYHLTLCSLCSSHSLGTRRPRRSDDPRGPNDPCDALRWKKAAHERTDSSSDPLRLLVQHQHSQSDRLNPEHRQSLQIPVQKHAGPRLVQVQGNVHADPRPHVKDRSTLTGFPGGPGGPTGPASPRFPCRPGAPLTPVGPASP